MIPNGMYYKKDGVDEVFSLVFKTDYGSVYCWHSFGYRLSSDTFNNRVAKTKDIGSNTPCDLFKLPLEFML